VFFRETVEKVLENEHQVSVNFARILLSRHREQSTYRHVILAFMF